MNSSARVLGMFFLSAVVFIAGLYVLFSLDLTQWQNVQASRFQVAQRQAVRDHLMDLISQFREKVAQFTDLDTQIKMIGSALPSSMNIPELLATIETVSGTANIKLDQITFTSLNAASAAAQSAPATAPGQPLAQQKALEVNVSIAGQGQYSDVKDFLHSLETELRLIDLGDLTITPLAASGNKTPQFSFKLDATAYYITQPQFSLP